MKVKYLNSDLSHKAVLIGELLVDFVPSQSNGSVGDSMGFEAHMGGAPANVAIACHGLGGQAELLSFVGRDWIGDWLLGQIEKLGLNNSGIERLVDETTPFALVRPDGFDGDKFSISPGWLGASNVSLTHIEAAVRSQIIYFGSCILSNSRFADKLLASLGTPGGARPLTIFDANIRPSLWEQECLIRPRIQPFLPVSDILKMSTEEADLVFGKGDVGQQMKRAHETGVWCVIITDGSASVRYSVAGEQGTVQPDPMYDRDTTGAGDVLVGSLIAYLLEGSDEASLVLTSLVIRDALMFATRVASLGASHRVATNLFSDEKTVEELRRGIH